MLVEVEDLRIEFAFEGRVSVPVRKVGFRVPENGRVALVGESGCGKSLTALALGGLVDRASITGEIRGTVNGVFRGTIDGDVDLRLLSGRAGPPEPKDAQPAVEATPEPEPPAEAPEQPAQEPAADQTGEEAQHDE